MNIIPCFRRYFNKNIFYKQIYTKCKYIITQYALIMTFINVDTEHETQVLIYISDT